MGGTAGWGLLRDQAGLEGGQLWVDHIVWHIRPQLHSTACCAGEVLGKRLTAIDEPEVLLTTRQAVRPAMPASIQHILKMPGADCHNLAGGSMHLIAGLSDLVPAGLNALKPYVGDLLGAPLLEAWHACSNNMVLSDTAILRHDQHVTRALTIYSGNSQRTDTNLGPLSNFIQHWK